MSSLLQEINQPELTSHKKRGRALVVDDDMTNRLVLKGFLSKAGFEVIQAENGQQAVDYYLEYQPDIILMDVMMPIMDGMESSRKIKSIANGDFIPIIFITAMVDRDTITRCINAGGDDFINKPVDNVQLQAKINSMERIRNMHKEIVKLHNKIYHEQKVSEHIFSDVVGKSNVEIEQMHTLLRPLDIFSGDIVLTAFTPLRDLHILLADFTGHGLSAALGAIPVSETFHAMTAKGYSIDEILKNINLKLKYILPTNMFMAVQYISISHELDYISVCNCAMPDIFILDKERKKIKEQIPSRGLPLGIDSNFNFLTIIEHHQIKLGDKIILCSDGIIESPNIDGEQFGKKRLKKALIKSKPEKKSHFEGIVDVFDEFCQGAEPLDDISLVEIPCIPENIPPCDIHTLLNIQEVDSMKISSEKIQEEALEDVSEINLLFNGKSLRNIDPVPLIINNATQVANTDIPRQSLFMILTELFVNALDHGILGLDSDLKSSAEGFEQYFNEREKRLNNLSSGHIRIVLKMKFNKNGGAFTIIFHDSGSGFNHKNYTSDNTNIFSGRGISLVKQLCSEVDYSENGTRVEAIFKWSSEELS